MLLERVEVEVLVAVGEIGARDARGRALPGEVVLDPHLALLRPEAAGDPVELGVAADPRAMRREVPRLAREVLERDVLDLRFLADEELDDGVRVAGESGVRRGELLDQAEPAAGLGDHEQAPEERAAVGRVRDPHVERPLEDHALRNVDEQAVLPARRVLGGELLVGPDELPELRMRLVEHLEADSLRRALDLDAIGVGGGQPGHVDVQHGLPCNSLLEDLAPFCVKPSGSKPFRSVKRHDSSVVFGSGSAR